MSNFILTDRKTDYQLPPSVDDWLTQDHLARFVVEVIDGLDLSNLTRQYAGRGSKAHHPATLLAILVYGYSTGVFSSRKLERATYSVAFRYIAAGSHPDHDTLPPTTMPSSLQFRKAPPMLTRCAIWWDCRQRLSARWRPYGRFKPLGAPIGRLGSPERSTCHAVYAS